MNAETVQTYSRRAAGEAAAPTEGTPVNAQHSCRPDRPFCKVCHRPWPCPTEEARTDQIERRRR